MRKLKVNDYVKIKDPERWTRKKGLNYIDGKESNSALNSDGKMDKYLGQVIKVIGVRENIFLSKSDENRKYGWNWDYNAIEKILTKQENPEYFI